MSRTGVCNPVQNHKGARQKGNSGRCLVVHQAIENYVAVLLAMASLLQPGVVVSQTAPRMSMHTPGTYGPTLSINPVRIGAQIMVLKQDRNAV